MRVLLLGSGMDGEADTNVVIPQRLHSCVFLLCYCFFRCEQTGVCATFSSVVFSEQSR